MSDNNSIQEIKLEDLNYFWTKNGVPCFMADKPGIEDIIESLGFSIYYLICNVGKDRKVETKASTTPFATTTTYVTDFSTQIVKVVNNFVGRSVTVVEDEDIYDFEPVREIAEYSLPAIPRVIVDKLDEFFRLVDAQHGTESIVILTFDPTKEDSTGWGVLVPEQTNTSVHCKYEADSIIQQKPDDVIIVGSVHSHPAMAAYASGTDHADQADFDGLHITYGWQKSVNNNATQYHIEMQMAGNHWTLKPEDVFEDFVITKDPDPEVVQWTQNVKKVLPPTGGSVSQVASTKATTQVSLTPQQDYTRLGTTKGDPRYQETPDPKDEFPHIVIAEIDYTDDNNCDCPSCSYALSLNDMILNYCPVCDIPLCDIQSSYSEVLTDTARYLRDRGINTNLNYYLWVKDNNKQDVLMRIADYQELDDSEGHPTLIESTSDITVEEIDPFYYEGFDENRTVCCNIPLENVIDCNCAKTVYYEDVMAFDEAHPYDLYDQSGACSSCQYYYSRECVTYFSSIMNFAQHGREVENKITECGSYMSYETSSSDNYSYNHY